MKNNHPIWKCLIEIFILCLIEQSQLYAQSGFVPGNGVIVNSVATDIHNSTNVSSLISHITAYPKTNIKYVFLDFGFITTEKPPRPIIYGCASLEMGRFSYRAVPQLKPLTSDIENLMGPCIDGYEVTKYFKESNIMNVIPMINYDPGFADEIKTNCKSDSVCITKELRALANQIANVINNDANANGVAFDNEPAIRDLFNSGDENMFFETIAKALLSKSKNLFLFDAPAAAIALHKNNISNVAILEPLYDQLGVPPGQPKGPYLLQEYSDSTVKQVENYFINPDKQNIPVLFVLPASATDTIWDYVQTFNHVPTGMPLKNPTTLVSSVDCTKPTGFNYEIMSKLLKCPTTNSCDAVYTFLDHDNCAQYTNPTALEVYFNASLAAEKQGLANLPSPPQSLIGNVLYTFRIDGFNNISCGIHYYSIMDDTSLYKLCNQAYPDYIPENIWMEFNK
jgi:hypothetical protein